MARIGWLGLLLVAAACASPGPSPATTRPTDEPTLTSQASASIATPSVATPTGRPSPTEATNPHAFPSLSEVPLEPARYASSPPFDVPFSFDVVGQRWESAHLHGEFFDLMQFGNSGSTQPTRWVAFARPAYFISDEEVAADGLAPEAAAAILAARSELRTGSVSPFELDGLGGVQLDISTDTEGVQLFGGPDGDFGMDPAYDLRLGIDPIEEELLLVLVLAPIGQLDQAWQLAEPILESVDL